MARVMLHRDVLKNFGKLPAKVQKKVTELISKFEHDSTQASIHLEVVNNVVDPKVRSARVGDDWRAILIAPQQGDTYLMMHVDHHDEAYRWCRNKRFEAHGALGMLQVFDVEQVEEAAERTNVATGPDQTSEYFPLDDLSDEDIFYAGTPRPLIPAVRAIRSREGFVEMAEYLPPEAAQVLFSVLDGKSLDDALAETLGETDAGAARPSGPGDFSKLDHAPSMDLVLVAGEEHLREILAEDIEEWRVFLHPKQRKMVEWRTNGPMKITGAAGTGKTVALMHRAAHLANGLSAPKDKVLVTTYTTNLSVTIEQLIRKLSATAANRIEVTNLHQLARTICVRSGWQGRIADDQDKQDIWEAVEPKFPKLDFSFDFIREEYESIVDAMGVDSEEEYLTVVRTGHTRLSRRQRRQLWSVFVEFNILLHKRNLLTFEGAIHQARMIAEKGRFPFYRHVLVDELQDFGLEDLRLIAAISPVKQSVSDPLCVVGDGHQRINRKIPIPLARAGLDVRGRARRLSVNYRTSEQIRGWAHQLLRGMPIDDLDGGIADTTGDISVFRGPPPELFEARTDGDVAKVVVEWVRRLREEFGIRNA